MIQREPGHRASVSIRESSWAGSLSSVVLPISDMLADYGGAEVEHLKRRCVFESRLHSERERAQRDSYFVGHCIAYPVHQHLPGKCSEKIKVLGRTRRSSE